jgi:hypothetical protein
MLKVHIHCLNFLKTGQKKNNEDEKLDDLHNVGAGNLAQDAEGENAGSVQGAPQLLNVQHGVGPAKPLTQHTPAH